MYSIDGAEFRRVLGHFPTGTTVVSAADPNGRAVGIVVGSFFSVSLEPALVGFCAAKSSTSWPLIRSAGAFCVNVLAEDQQDMGRHFAAPSPDKFAGISWTATATGSPRLPGVLAWIDCEITSVHDAGDHEICIGGVRELAAERDAGPLLFWRSGFGRFTA